MTPTTPEAWLNRFAAQYGIRPAGTPGDPSVAGERAEIAATYAANHVPAKFRNALPATPEVERWLATVIESGTRRLGGTLILETGPSLLLVGVTGVGKTYELYGAMRALALLGIHAPWQVIPAADLYARLRPRHGVDSEAEFASIANAPVLAVDDLGAGQNRRRGDAIEKTSPFVEEVNFRLVNRRYENDRPTLFTSNLAAPDLREHLGDRTASRLAEMTTHVPIKGQDRRRAA